LEESNDIRDLIGIEYKKFKKFLIVKGLVLMIARQYSRPIPRCVY
jgi:hypothetical protein